VKSVASLLPSFQPGLEPWEEYGAPEWETRPLHKPKQLCHVRLTSSLQHKHWPWLLLPGQGHFSVMTSAIKVVWFLPLNTHRRAHGPGETSTTASSTSSLR
jgi:hypothetical protein